MARVRSKTDIVAATINFFLTNTAPEAVYQFVPFIFKEKQEYIFNIYNIH